MDFAVDLISHHGYAALFGLLVLGIVGLPIPDEALLTFVGYVCFRGELHPLPAVVTAFLGTACDITISYGLGRALGLPALNKMGRLLHAQPHHIMRAQRSIQRWGAYALPVAYFLPGVRHLAALLAGTARVSLKHFAEFAYPGALVWCGTFIGIGYGLGAEWSRLSPPIHRAVVLVALTVVAGIVVALVLIRWHERRKAEPAN